MIFGKRVTIGCDDSEIVMFLQRNLIALGYGTIGRENIVVDGRFSKIVAKALAYFKRGRGLLSPLVPGGKIFIPKHDVYLYVLENGKFEKASKVVEKSDIEVVSKNVEIPSESRSTDFCAVCLNRGRTFYMRKKDLTDVSKIEFNEDDLDVMRDIIGANPPLITDAISCSPEGGTYPTKSDVLP